MSKDLFDQFIKHHKKVNALVDKETRKLSFQEKFKQLSSLLSLARQTGLRLRKDKHLFTNWTMLKSKI